MLYKQVMQDLKARINSSEFAIGDTLPTEKQLIEEYSVSRITVRKAIDGLVRLGLVEKRQGAGSSIVAKTMVTSMLNLKSTNEYFDESSKLEYKTVEFTLIDVNKKLAKILQIKPKDKVYFIRRIKFINGVACVYEDSYMPMQLFPQMNVMKMQDSKYRYLEKELGFEIDGAFQDFAAITPSKDMCEMLQLNDKSPLISVLSTGILKDGRVFEYTEITTKPEIFSYRHYLKRPT